MNKGEQDENSTTLIQVVLQEMVGRNDSTRKNSPACFDESQTSLQMAALLTGNHPVVRWYLRYSLSYRHVEEMMRERGLAVW